MNDDEVTGSVSLRANVVSANEPTVALVYAAGFQLLCRYVVIEDDHASEPLMYRNVPSDFYARTRRLSVMLKRDGHVETGRAYVDGMISPGHFDEGNECYAVASVGAYLMQVAHTMIGATFRVRSAHVSARRLVLSSQPVMLEVVRDVRAPGTCTGTLVEVPFDTQQQPAMTMIVYADIIQERSFI